MSVGINLKVDTNPFTTLRTELKGAKKDLADALKQVDELQKKGDKVTDELYRKVNEAERRVGGLQSRLQTDGKRLKFDEKFNQRMASNNESLNITGMLRDRVEQQATSLLRGPAAQAALGRLGPIGQAVAKGAMDGGLAGAGEAIGASSIGAAAGYAALAYGAYKVFQTGLSITNNFSESRNRADRDYRSQMSNAQFTDGVDRMLAEKGAERRAMEGDILGQLGSNAVLKYGGFGVADWIRQRAAGVDDYSLADTRVNQSLRKASVVNSADFAAVKDTAEFRVLSDRYGSTAFGAIAQNNPLRRIANSMGLGSNETAKETVDKVVEMITEFQQRTAEATRRVEQNDFAGARAEFDLAKQALPQSAWRDPVNTWMVLEAGRRTTAIYAINQNPLPPLRIGQ